MKQASLQEIGFSLPSFYDRCCTQTKTEKGSNPSFVFIDVCFVACFSVYGGLDIETSVDFLDFCCVEVLQCLSDGVLETVRNLEVTTSVEFLRTIYIRWTGK